MKHPILKTVPLLSALVLPVAAVEPPVESAPIQPLNVPGGKDPFEAGKEQAEKGRVGEVSRPIQPAQVEERVAPVEPVPAADSRPYLGVILDPVPEILAGHLRLEPGEGVVVAELVGGGPAEEAGIKVSDVITRVSGRKVGSAADVRAAVEGLKAGDEIKVRAIHAGKERELSVALGAAPQSMPGGGFEPNVGGLEREAWEGLPERHADLIREAMERNLKAFEELERRAGDSGNIQRDLLRRLRRGFQGLEAESIGGMRAESSIRLLDEQGSIEMKSRDGHKEARVFDNEGNLLWEGPYDTEQDRAAVPDDIRQRLDRVDLDLNFGGGGLKFRFGPERFRPLEEMDFGEEGGEVR